MSRRRRRGGRSRYTAPEQAVAPTAPPVAAGVEAVPERRENPGEAAPIAMVRPAARRAKKSADADVTPNALPGVVSATYQGNVNRQTLPTNANVLGMMPWAFLPRRTYQAMDLTTIESSAFSAQQLMELLADAMPELSLALWNFQRLAASGWKYQCRTIDNTDDDPEAQAVLDEIVGRVNKDWGGFPALINQWIMSVALQGAGAGETIPNEDVDDVVDIVTVQPWSIFFQRAMDQAFLPFQWQPMIAAAAGGAYMSNDQLQAQQEAFAVLNAGEPAPSPYALLLGNALGHGGFRLLNTATFAYVPLDADVDDPYGRTPFGPVIQLVAWDAQMLKDLRQWSHVHAFGRLDVKVLANMVQDMMPPNVKTNAAERLKWFTTYLTTIQEMYNQINPDDAMVHYDNVELSSVSATQQTFQIDSLIKVIERRIFRALKQLPILMGSNEGTTETWGTLQMEVYALGIANIQRVVASLCEKLLEVALRIKGHTAKVVFEFETLRASDRAKEANADSLEMRNAAFARDQGWITQDEASIQVTGSEAVADAPDPDQAIANQMPDQGSKHAAPPEAGEAEGGSEAGEPAEAGEGEDESKEAGNPKPDAKEAPQEGKEAAEDQADEKEGRSQPVPKDERLRQPERTPGDGQATAVEAGQDGRQAGQDAVAGSPSGGPGLSTERRPGIASSGEATRPETRSETRSEKKPKHRPPSSERRALAHRMATDVGEYFRTTHITRRLLEEIIKTHRSESTANWRNQHPDIASGVTKLIATHVARLRDEDAERDQDLSEAERVALQLSIIAMLTRELPDYDGDLFDVLQSYHQSAWNLGGQEALDHVGLKGEFKLSNPDLLSQIDQTAMTRTAMIQATTRKRLANTIISGLESGYKTEEIIGQVDDALEGMAGSRATGIASFEIPDGFFTASLTTWQRNGITYKVWVTSGDPDPGAGATGETPCRDNSYAGAIPMDDLFPSGDDAPPAHNYCECDVQPSGDPSDAAYADPWLGS